MKRAFAAIFLALSLAIGTAFAADLTGKWTATMTTPDGNTIPINYTLKQEGTKLTGTSEGPGGAIEIKDGKVEGDKVSFYITFEGGNGAMKISHSGTINGDEITLKFSMEGGPGGDFPALKLTRVKA